jgi:hypothetical protein
MQEAMVPDFSIQQAVARKPAPAARANRQAEGEASP